MGIDEFLYPCKHGSVSFCREKEQHSLFNKLSSKEKDVFSIYTNKIYPSGNINLKKNISQIKDIMEKWIKASGLKSDHQLGLALDFSSNTPTTQRDDLVRLLESQEYKLYTLVYETKNFHVSQK